MLQPSTFPGYSQIENLKQTSIISIYTGERRNISKAEDETDTHFLSNTRLEGHDIIRDTPPEHVRKKEEHGSFSNSPSAKPSHSEIPNFAGNPSLSDLASCNAHHQFSLSAPQQLSLGVSQQPLLWSSEQPCTPRCHQETRTQISCCRKLVL